MDIATDKFKDIRPYRDHEIRPVLQRLIRQPEFLDSIAGFTYPRLSRLLPPLMRALVTQVLRQQLRGVHDVASMQRVIADYMDKMIARSSAGLESSGLDNLQPGRSHLFICNHRDIALDPAFVNYLLHQAGHPTMQIAIGDNLLHKPFVSDMMRLNKSFIVRRSLKGRELLQSLKTLSEYIHHCIAGGENVWIAQREGRAKDGIDRTDPALLKMLAMGRRDLSLGKSLARLHILPVAISYELDACDVLKAEERYQTESGGGFSKGEGSDIEAIVTGITGSKGRVHVAFGKELQIDEDEPETIAAQIDRQIVHNYRLRGINFAALQLLQERGLLSTAQTEKATQALREQDYAQARQTLLMRLQPVSPHLHPYILFNYANPVLNRYNAL